MTDYTLNRPQATELLSESQPILKDNFTALDDTFGIDHYKFSLNSDPNKGFHNQVTTPLILGAAHPTTTTNPIMYAMQDTADIGVIQYSRGPNDAVPSPITELHNGTSPISLTSGSGQDILDMNGTTLVIGTVYIALAGSGTQNMIRTHFYWNSAKPGFQFLESSSSSNVTVQITVISNGTRLRLKNVGTSTVNNIFWTLVLNRIVT